MVVSGAELKRRAVPLTSQELSGTSSHSSSAVDALFDALQSNSDIDVGPGRHGYHRSRQDKVGQSTIVGNRNRLHGPDKVKLSTSEISAGDREKTRRREAVAAVRRHSGNDYYQVSPHFWGYSPTLGKSDIFHLQCLLFSQTMQYTVTNLCFVVFLNLLMAKHEAIINQFSC
jgi:hypothetical protein